MVTGSEERPATLASGFDFARQQRDPAFRQHLRDIGWTPGQHVVITADDEPVVAVVSRIIFNRTSSPCLIAMPHEEEPFGFRLMFAEVAAERRPWSGRKAKPIEIAPESSIGMLYDALGRCGEYVPSEWARPVEFKRVATPA